ncbi:MAG: PPE family protein [Mycobacterium sp.]|uniref:PPE family protein n=1 Tax=Mycobacterium sp. TaxID=1785 RepID=UPI003CC6A294
MEVTSLPPEVTSALIESGPGAESLIEASTAWQQLGAGLEESAENYANALSSLAGSWRGPSSSAMTQAVQPYITWLRTTAQQSQQLSSSAQAAATAFNSVRSAVVPLANVIANRMRLVQLLATNEFGNKLPAIAETEQEYQEMWANNSAAMIRYQTASAQATSLPQFSSPPSITNPAGTAAQASAVPASAASSSATRVAAAATPAAPVAAAAAAAAPINLGFADPTTGYIGLANQYSNQFISSGFPINLLSYLAQNTSAQALQGVQSQIGQGLSEGESALGPLGAGLGAPGAGFGSPGAGAFGGISEAPTAAMGAGWSVGKLTAPPAVGTLLPTSQAEVRLASLASPLPVGQSGMPMLPPLMPPPISPGTGWRKRKQQKYDDIEIGLDIKGKVMPRPPSAG